MNAGPLIFTPRRDEYITPTVNDYYAVGDGITNDTAAIAAAIAAVNGTGGTLLFPPGNYLVNAAEFTNLSFVRLVGAAHYASQITFIGSGTAGWTFSNAQACVLSNLYFVGNGGTVANGVVFNAGSGINTVEECQFVAFSADGLQLTGTALVPSSGNKVADCLFLQNGGKQLHCAYSHDFWIEGNQFGITTGTPTPDYGCYLDNSNAGCYTRNVHWENQVGFFTVDSHYNRIEMNRFEENHGSGVHLTAGVHIIFTGNTIHSNSKGTVGGADNAAFTTITDTIVSDNQSFDWTGSPQSNFGFAFGVACDRLTIKGNQATNYNASPFFFDTSLSGPMELNGDESMRVLSGVTVAAGGTSYMGPAGGSATQGPAETSLGRRVAAVRLYVACGSAPGAGQTFTYTVMKNSVATLLAATVSGATDDTGHDMSDVLICGREDRLTVRVVASGGAAETVHRATITLLEY